MQYVLHLIRGNSVIGLTHWLPCFFAAQVLGHYHGHYPAVINSSITALYMRAKLLISQWISVKSAVTRVFFTLLSHILSNWGTARGLNFIVYVFIHCEAGITDFTRSFKQLSEYSIDSNVNTRSNWASVTQLEVQQLSSLSFIVSQRGKSVFLKLLIKLLQHPSGSGDLWNWKTRKWNVDIDCII